MRPLPRFVAVLLAAVVASLATAAVAAPLGTAPAWTYQGSGFIQTLGDSVAVGGVNGDGYADLLVNEGTSFSTSGRVHVFFGGVSGPASTPSQTLTSATSGFGRIVAYLGDWNGDGFGDVAISSNFNEVNQVEVRYGSPAGLSAAADWSTTRDCCSFGQGLGAAGDVNGDGYADLLAGNPYYSSTAHAEAGRAYLFLGGLAASTAPAWTFDGDSDYGNLGNVLSGAGDVNADGFDDIIVSENWFSDLQGNRSGKVFVFLGQDGGAATTPVWITTGPLNSVYGWAVGPAGDVNGDGFGDIIVTDNQANIGQKLGMAQNGLRRGRAFVYLGSSGGPKKGADWTVTGDVDQAHLGYNIASGDIDHDGFSDVAISAPLRPSPGFQQGRIYLYRGGPHGLSRTAAWFVDGGQEGAGLEGMPLAIGDVNSDNLGDLLVGVPAWDTSSQDVGRAELYQGGAP